MDEEQQVNFFRGMEEATAECRTIFDVMNAEGHQFNEALNNQAEGLQSLNGTLAELRGNTSDLVETLEGLQAMMRRKEQEVASVNQEYAKFKSEIERLTSLKNYLETPEDNYDIVETEDEIIQKDLLRYTRSDADLKRKDLNLMKAKSDKLESELFTEWRNLKLDIKKFREERRYYDLQIRNVHNTAIFKFKQLQNLKSDPKEKDQIGRVIDYLQTQRRIRNLGDDVILKSLTKWNDSLGDKLERMKGHDVEGEECGHPLHRTVRHIDLPNRDAMTISQHEMEDDESPVQNNQYRLHRCKRQTNVAIPLDLIEDADLLPLCMSDEKVSDQSGMESDVSSELSDFPNENQQCGLELHRCRNKMDISLPPELLEEGDRALLLSIIQSDGEDDRMSVTSSLLSDNEVIRDINLELEQSRHSPKAEVAQEDAMSENESMEPHHEGGRELHRCYRSTNIALSPSLVEEMDRCLVLGLNNVEDRDILTDTEPSTTSDEEPEQNGADQEIEDRAQRPDAIYINPANYRCEGHATANDLSLVEKLQSSPTGSSTSSSGVTRRAVTAGTRVHLLGKQNSERKMDNSSGARITVQVYKLCIPVLRCHRTFDSVGSYRFQYEEWPKAISSYRFQYEEWPKAISSYRIHYEEWPKAISSYRFHYEEWPKAISSYRFHYEEWPKAISSYRFHYEEWPKAISSYRFHLEEWPKAISSYRFHYEEWPKAISSNRFHYEEWPKAISSYRFHYEEWPKAISSYRFHYEEWPKAISSNRFHYEEWPKAISSYRFHYEEWPKAISSYSFHYEEWPKAISSYRFHYEEWPRAISSLRH
ncbi:hypothetical protein FSP39_002066 [Pinctada imbricata]|uniref:Uncharacterized protein n=1 Tax=Pinctada imbricata TaxID=66713 RepID=A0AA88YC76_PINIB|nr:hypothetical protein FSP39_002066 [Pinctada imbricata]